MHLLLAFALFTAPCDPKPWQRAFKQYVTTYPKAQAADLHKFAHQAIIGSEHAVGDTASVCAEQLFPVRTGVRTRVPGRRSNSRGGDWEHKGEIAFVRFGKRKAWNSCRSTHRIREHD